jgi:xanthine dehydrogenase accessory factor
MTVDVPGLVVVRGAGDIATGVIQKLVHAGFRVLALEVPQPMAIRWRAALCTAVREGRWAVEDLAGVRVGSWDEASRVLDAGLVPVLVDEAASVLDEIRPLALVDAVLAKRNVGTRRDMAGVVVGLGPGFSAGDDVHFVVETMRGHDLGRVISEGPALPNTGIPGLIAGRAAERVLHAPIAGVVSVTRGIGDIVEADEMVCTVASEAEGGEVAEVRASIGGVVRGMIPDGYRVRARFKIADVDPRTELAAWVDTVSDKSRAVGGGALDAVLQGLGGWRP